MTQHKKRSANGDGTIRKREDGRWEARVTTGFDPKTGKQKQVSIYGKTQAEVRTKKTEMLASMDYGSYLEPRKETYAQWLDIWLKLYVSTSCNPYTLDSYTRICNNHIKPKLEKIRLNKLNALVIQDLYNSLQTEKGLSPKTIRGVHNVVHRSLGQAQKLQMIASNPAELCNLPKAVKKDIEPMRRDEVASWLRCIRGHRYEYLYQVTLFTGLRESEVLALTWDCIDFKDCTITINKQLHKTKKVCGSYELAETKNKRARRITVAPSVIEILQKQQIKQSELQEKAGIAWGNEWNLVVTNELGGHLCQCTVYKKFKEIVKEMGLTDQRFHDLRHGYVLASLEMGVDIKTISENLGHATTAFTMDRYGHVSEVMQKQAAGLMEEYYQSVSE